MNAPDINGIVVRDATEYDRCLKCRGGWPHTQAEHDRALAVQNNTPAGEQHAEARKAR
jgi:Zn-finger nucleic acid-binding protein